MKIWFAVSLAVILINSAGLASAHNGGHPGCFQGGCPSGHCQGAGGCDGIPNTGDECPWTDPPCDNNASKSSNYCDTYVSMSVSYTHLTLPTTPYV